jgi:hypothetical protein
MGYELYRMIRDGAPSSWTGPMVHVAQAIADDARDPVGEIQDGWPWSALPVKGYWDHRRGRWRDGLAERTGMSPRAISRALADLAGADYEMREQISKDRRGRPVFAAKGHALRFQVPPLTPRAVPECSPSTATFAPVDNAERSPATATVDPEPDGQRSPSTASIEGQRSPSTASKVAKDGDPISSGSPQNSNPLTAKENSGLRADVEGNGLPTGQNLDQRRPGKYELAAQQVLESRRGRAAAAAAEQEAS